MTEEMARLKWRFHTNLQIHFVPTETILKMHEEREAMGGKLEDLWEKLPEKEHKKFFLKPIKYRLKESEKKYYHHLGSQFDDWSWRVPTKELDDREDEYINACLV